MNCTNGSIYFICLPLLVQESPCEAFITCPFCLFCKRLVYIYPVVVSPLRDMSGALLCFNNVAIHSVYNKLSPTTQVVTVLAPTGVFPVFTCNAAFDCLYIAARNTNALKSNTGFPCYMYKAVHFVVTLIFWIAHSVFQSLTYLMVLISQNLFSMQLSLYCHDLFKIVLLMHCVPQENPCVLSYIAFMRTVRNMILKHDYLARINCHFLKSVMLTPKLQQLLHNAKSQTVQLELLYYRRSYLPQCLYLPWLFHVLDLLFLCIGSFQVTIPNNGSRSLFVPPVLLHSKLANSGTHSALHSVYGGGGQHIFPFDVVSPHIIAESNVNHDHGFKFIDHIDSVSQIAYPVQQNFVHAKVPLGDIIPYLPLRMGRKIAPIHHITIGSHVSKSELSHYFESHDCISCNLYSSMFAIVNSKTMNDRLCKCFVRLNINNTATLLNEHCSSIEDNTDGCVLTPPVCQTVNNMQNSLDEVHTIDPIVDPFVEPLVKPIAFPPTLLDNALSQRIISDFCENSSPSALEEAGCAVCRILYPLKQLTRLKAIKNLLPILQASGVTRIERCKAVHPIREFKGPVLDHSCSRVCDECRKNL